VKSCWLQLERLVTSRLLGAVGCVWLQLRPRISRPHGGWLPIYSTAFEYLYLYL
jgi:hypothetical protein